MAIRRALTPTQQGETTRLRKAWKEYKSRNPHTSQEAVAGRIGWTQGALSHYITGNVPVNLEALLAICAELEVDVAEISPRFAELMISAGFVPARCARITLETLQLGAQIDAMPAERRAPLLQVIRFLASKAATDETVANAFPAVQRALEPIPSRPVTRIARKTKK